MTFKESPIRRSMNHTRENNLTRKNYLVRMLLIFNLVSFISFQLILAPCIYAEDMSKATKMFIQRSDFSPLVATNDNHMEEIEELEQKEKELKERENQILKYKRMVATGKILQWSALGVGIAGAVYATTLVEKYTVRDPETGKQLDYDPTVPVITGLGSIALGLEMWLFGINMVKKGEKGLEGLSVSYKNNGLANEYYVSYQYNF